MREEQALGHERMLSKESETAVKHDQIREIIVEGLSNGGYRPDDNVSLNRVVNTIISNTSAICKILRKDVSV